MKDRNLEALEKIKAIHAAWYELHEASGVHGDPRANQAMDAIYDVYRQVIGESPPLVAETNLEIQKGTK